ncbi:polysaccharide deacetylase family protein [Brevibacillus humidisoli]|uniref:polysaccharide deacetylase family protein n=1 Tax=Brevibacillus humidisoli TaxID=2895522 RepID=UPI001E407368|nr:polysaccharide deacetylase family protein [Brevibacillus humidisoli]UFJ38917.1 polysaccharide deacetylase family protein [Brevibacillus humidisoli]
MKKRMILLCVVLLSCSLLLYGGYRLMNSRTYQLFGELTSYVETDQKVVALTFDDGPTENVAQILPLLDQYKAKATFFVIGSELEKNLALGEKIAKAEHQLGNHTYSHQPMIFKSLSFIEKDIEKTSQLIRKTGYEGELDFRPPNGKKLVALPYYLKTHQIQTIMWNLEPDSYYSTATEKVEYVQKNVKPGSIILLHPMYDTTGSELEAIEGILAALSKEGYRFVTVNELQNLQKVHEMSSDDSPQ